MTRPLITAIVLFTCIISFTNGQQQRQGSAAGATVGQFEGQDSYSSKQEHKAAASGATVGRISYSDEDDSCHDDCPNPQLADEVVDGACWEGRAGVGRLAQVYPAAVPAVPAAIPWICRHGTTLHSVLFWLCSPYM